jgi:RNA:NAD 2'-phosphotransferase (TPT1/KptA family)
VGTHGTDPDVKLFFDSLKIERSRDRAILTATVPPGFIQKALAEAPSDQAPAVAQPSKP